MSFSLRAVIRWQGYTAMRAVSIICQHITPAMPTRHIFHPEKRPNNGKIYPSPLIALVNPKIPIAKKSGTINI